MAILCGTDFSAGAEAALQSAWALAKRMHEPLHLVHVLDPSIRRLDDAGRHAVETSARRHLSHLVESLGEGASGRVHSVLRVGHVDEELAQCAAAERAWLIVVSSVGHRNEPRFRLGGTSERLAITATVATMVVRDAGPFVRWSRGELPLRVTAAVDDSRASDAVLSLLRTLSRHGPLDVTLARVYFPEDLVTRFGRHLTNVNEPTPALEEALREDLLVKLGRLENSQVRVVLKRGVGRAGDHILQVANEQRADAIFIGTHQATNLARLPSVSSLVLHEAAVSVAVVPAEAASLLAAPPAPRVRRVLAAVDFGHGSSEVIAWAYGLLSEQRGEVHLVHVVPTARNGDALMYALPELEARKPPVEEAHAALEVHMRSLIPTAATRPGVETAVHIVRSPDLVKCVTELGERLAVDVLCVGSHRRTGMAHAILGSTAEELLRSSHRPVFIAWQRMD